MADGHDLLDHLRGRVGARAPELADDGGCADPLKHCRTLIEAESEASKDTKEAQAHLDQNVLARYAAVARVSILGPSGGLFSAAARPGQRPFSYWAQTWHSKIEIRDEYRK